MLAVHGFQLKPSTDDHAQFHEFVRRALLEPYRRSSARHRQDFSTPFFDDLFGPEVHSATSTQDMAFGKLCDRYFNSSVSNAANTKVSQQRVDRVRSRLKLVREIISEDTMLSAIEYDQSPAFRGTPAQVPINRAKFYPGVPLQEAINRTKIEKMIEVVKRGIAILKHNEIYSNTN